MSEKQRVIGGVVYNVTEMSHEEYSMMLSIAGDETLCPMCDLDSNWNACLSQQCRTGTGRLIFTKAPED